jgi:hypothetical protein
MYEIQPGVAAASSSREAAFLEACSMSVPNPSNVTLTRFLGSFIRLAMDVPDLTPLRDAVTIVHRDHADVDVNDLLCAAAFSIEEQLLMDGAFDLPVKVRRINCIVRDVQLSDETGPAPELFT